MSADEDRATAADDLKAQFKEALAKKHDNASGAVDKNRAPQPKQHNPHQAEGAKRGFIRRKTG